MKAWMVIGGPACLALSGCQKPGESSGSPFGSSPRGRYLGVAVYAPGRMWEQIARTNAPTDPAAATLKDDDQVIVVVDSATGEIRQCGALSGFCTKMNPWTGPGAPTALLKHAQQLDEARAAPPEQGRAPE